LFSQLQRSELHVLFQQTLGNELLGQILPFCCRMVETDGVGRQLVVAALKDLLGLGAAQHVDDVGSAEAFARALDAGEKLLGFDRHVHSVRHLRWIADSRRSEPHGSASVSPK
jgi:hypothetical protein